MEQDAINPETAQRSSAGSATAIPGTSTDQKHLQMPRSLKQKAGYMTFGKSRIFYTYGYAYQNIVVKQTSNNQDVGDIVYLTTPICIGVT